MDPRSRHLGVWIERPAADVYAYVVEPPNLPRWAPGLADSVTLVDGGWVVESPMGRAGLAFVDRNELGVLDHDVTLPTGETVRNPMRVIPGDGGCDVVFTVRRRQGMTDEDVDRDAAAVAVDLATLKRVLETGTGETGAG